MDLIGLYSGCIDVIISMLYLLSCLYVLNWIAYSVKWLCILKIKLLLRYILLVKYICM